MFVDKSGPSVRFVQVTSRKKHSFKFRFFRNLLNQFELKAGKVEIFFVVSLINVEGFAISEVSGEGMLAAFSTSEGDEMGQNLRSRSLSA